MTRAKHAAHERRRRLGAPWIALLVLTLSAALSGAALGSFMRRDLPAVRALEDYAPPLMTRVLSGDGALLDTFAEQRRILIGFSEIPQSFLDALLATEDTNFYRHTGIDFKGILRAAWRDLRSMELAQGASTITQQLARNLFLERDKTVRRKVQEVLLAVEIERHYAKPEILQFYCNQIYMGHGRYGIEAASRFYFGMPARDLALNQVALLAGLIQRPEGLSPLRHPDRALKRRNHVLRRMADVGVLTPELYEETRATPLDLGSRDGRGDLAPYFVEEVRRWLQDRYGSSSLYQEGLEIRTTLDPALQDMANRAVDAGLRELDKRQGWRGPHGKLPDGEDPQTWNSPNWSAAGVEAGTVYDAVVVSASKSSIEVRVGDLRGALDREAYAWTDEQDGRKLLAPGDLARVRVVEVDADGAVRLALEQEPVVEAALVALDPSTGAVLALVGGFDFERSEYDRATQALRQTGSAFKPFVYTAALDAGWTLADTILDEPTVFLDPNKPEPYQPENFSHAYHGTITLRRALEKSANIATVKLLDEIGYRAVIDTADRLGIAGRLRPFASMALGAFETSLIELTSAYGAFANQGVLVAPHMIQEIRDHDGATIERIEPAVRDAVTPQTAYLMNRLLEGVITDGTGRAASGIRHPIAGKTGTTDDNTDAWFVGYSPHLAVGVWVGFDEPRSLGKKETGAKAALPIWRAFVAEALAGRPIIDFPMPAGITTATIDRRTGLKASRAAYCSTVATEYFASGTEPTAYCSVYHHQWLRLPYALQRYPLNEQGEIEVPAAELDRLLVEDPTLRIADGGRRLEAYLPAETVALPLRIVPGGETVDPVADPRLEEFDLAEWVGKDGRPAAIVWIDGRPRRRL